LVLAGEKGRSPTPDCAAKSGTKMRYVEPQSACEKSLPKRFFLRLASEPQVWVGGLRPISPLFGKLNRYNKILN